MRVRSFSRVTFYHYTGDPHQTYEEQLVHVKGKRIMGVVEFWYCVRVALKTFYSWSCTTAWMVILFIVSFQTVICYLTCSLADACLRWLDVSLPSSLRLHSVGLMVVKMQWDRFFSQVLWFCPVIIILKFGVHLSSLLHLCLIPHISLVYHQHCNLNNRQHCSVWWI